LDWGTVGGGKREWGGGVFNLPAPVQVSIDIPGLAQVFTDLLALAQVSMDLAASHLPLDDTSSSLSDVAASQSLALSR
jgi:hypothetical protein